MNNFASKDDLLNALKRDVVDLPDGKQAYVRELGGTQLLEYKERLEELRAAGGATGLDGGLEIVSLIVSMSACDENGTLMFSKDDLPAIKGMSVAVLNLMSEKAMEISGQADVANRLKKSLTDSDTSSTDSPVSLEEQSPSS